MSVSISKLSNSGVEESKIVALEEIYEMDKSIKKIANLDYGKKAYRKDKNSKWSIQ